MKNIKNKETIIELIKYIIFGGLTTLVSLAGFKLFDFLLGEKLYLVSNVISWIFAVAFAFVTNKLWVFDSKSWQARIVVREALSFAGARLFSLGIEEAGLWLLISVCGMENMQPWVLFGFSFNGAFIAKLIMQVVVVILNYIFSKLVIFKKKKEEQA